MKSFSKSIVVLSLCVSYFFAFGHVQEAWSAPQGKVVVGLGADPSTLDPHMHTENPAFIVLRQVNEQLVRRIMENDEFKHYPMLATSWQAINETTWVFNLRKGVKFHNGEDFNAEAVKYSLERVLNPGQKARWRYAFTTIDRIDIVEPYTIRITTKVPDPTLVMNLGFVMPIVPPKYFSEKSDAYVAGNPVGTGPFKFVSRVKDSQIVLEANENHWGGPPKIKTLIFKPIPEAFTRVSALMGGDVDIIEKVPSDLIPMINKSKIAKVTVVPSTQAMAVHLDSLKAGPLQDKRVRQALNYGVDKEAIIKHVLEGYGKPLGGPVTPFVFGYDPDVKPYPYNPEKAKALLKEAGYEKGLSLTLNSPTGKYDKDKEFSEAIAGQLSKIGVDVKLVVHEWGSYVARRNSPEGLGPMNVLGWGGSDADFILYPLLHCGQPQSKWCNKEFDSLIEQGRGTLDTKKREALYSKALKICHEEAPWIFLFYGVYAYGINQRVNNFKPTPDETTSYNMHEVWLKD